MSRIGTLVPTADTNLSWPAARAASAPAFPAGARGSQCAWAYFVPIAPDARVLYAGPDGNPLRRWSSAVEWFGGPVGDHGGGTAADRYALVVLEDLPLAIQVFARSWRCSPSPHRMFQRMSTLLTPGGRLVLTFRAATVRSRLRGERRMPVRSVTRALRAAGFAHQQIFHLRDDISVPELHAVQTGADSLRSRLTMGAVCVVARRDREQSCETGIRLILGRLPTAAGDRTDTAATVHVGSGAVHRIHAGGSIIRMPQHPLAVPRCTNNYAMLRHLQQVTLPFDVPRPLGSSTFNGLPVFGESRASGTSADYQRLTSRARSDHAASGIEALIAMERATRSEPTRLAGVFESHFRAAAVPLLPHLDAERRDLLEQFLTAVARDHAPAPLCTVAVHGDFKIANLLWNGHGAVAGLVDWDLSATHGLPVVDYVTYRAFDRAVERQQPICQGMADMVIATAADAAYVRFCRDCLNMTERAYAACAVMALVHYGTHHHGILSDAEHRAWCSRQVSGPLGTACRRFLAETGLWA